MPKGGLRPGAGRPPGTVPKKNFCLYLPVELIRWVHEHSYYSGIPKSILMESIISDYREKQA